MQKTVMGCLVLGLSLTLVSSGLAYKKGVTVLNAPGQQDETRLKEQFKAMGWARSAWKRRKIVHLSDSKVHVDTEFTRYRADGTEIASYDSLYILIKEGDRWGIKMRSSFAK